MRVLKLITISSNFYWYSNWHNINASVWSGADLWTFDQLYNKLILFSLQALKARGYERLVLQTGRGSIVPAADSCPDVRLEAYRFKDSIAEDIKQADLVISHAG